MHQLHHPVMDQAADSIQSATRLTFRISCEITAFFQ